jgi:hypothetical protein
MKRRVPLAMPQRLCVMQNCFGEGVPLPRVVALRLARLRFTPLVRVRRAAARRAVRHCHVVVRVPTGTRRCRVLGRPLAETEAGTLGADEESRHVPSSWTCLRSDAPVCSVHEQHRTGHAALSRPSGAPSGAQWPFSWHTSTWSSPGPPQLALCVMRRHSVHSCNGGRSETASTTEALRREADVTDGRGTGRPWSKTCVTWYDSAAP